MNLDNMKCPFCRVPTPNHVEVIKMYKKRMEMDDANAIYNVGCYYRNGELGFPRDSAKAFELFLRAGELGSAKSYYNVGNAYLNGEGVEMDMKQAKHYWELAAVGGYTGPARYNLGIIEKIEGNMSIALKHYMIAVECGHDLSLKKVREFYTSGHATKDDYANALRSYQNYLDRVKSAQRDEAAAFDSDEYRYY